MLGVLRPAAHGSRSIATLEKYHENGFCFPLPLFSSVGKPFSETFFPRYQTFRNRCLQQGLWSEYRFKSHLLLPWLHDLLVGNDRLKDAACALLQTDTVLIWSTDWCVKPRSSPEHFTWHQDSTYSKFGNDAATVWLAFSQVGEHSGPLLFRSKSHLLGQLPHSESTDVSNLLAFGQYIPDTSRSPASEVEWTELETVPAYLQPGEASVHSFLTIHSSQANQEQQDRVGLAIRIVAASAGVHRHDRVTHLCGTGNVYNFELEDAPREEFGSKELASWNASMEREKAMYFSGQDRSYK